MAELHPSPTARYGHLPADTITRGLHADVGPYSVNKDVYCQQCGFVCNLDRDMRNVNEFAGETIASGTELSNGSFENWTVGTPDSWTVSGTITQETAVGNYDKSDDGSSSAKVTRSSSNISISQAMATPSNFNSNIIVFRARVKSNTNGIIRLRVDINSTSYYSSYNIAQQRFQELAVIISCPTVVSSLTVYVLADNANGTAYVDQVTLMRNGNPTVITHQAGCPLCNSYNYA